MAEIVSIVAPFEKIILRCEWTITASYGYSVNLVFDDFDLASSGKLFSMQQFEILFSQKIIPMNFIWRKW